MISVIVQRNPADFQGPDISDPLIATDAQAVARGTAEVDKLSTDRVDVSGTCSLHSYMEPGSIVLVTDLQLGQYKAMLKMFSLSVTRQPNGTFSASTNVTLEREE